MLKYWSQMLGPAEEVHAYLREAIPVENLTYLNLSPSIKRQQVGPKLTGLVWENSSMALRARRTDVFFGRYSLPLLARVTRKLVVATHRVNQAQAGAHPWRYNFTYDQRGGLSALTAVFAGRAP